jgi:hypothetical protein
MSLNPKMPLLFLDTLLEAAANVSESRSWPGLVPVYLCARPCTALHCTALHCTALHCTALQGLASSNLHCKHFIKAGLIRAVRCGAVQCSAVQCSSAVRCSAVRCGLIRADYIKFAQNRSKFYFIQLIYQGSSWRVLAKTPLDMTK